MIGRARFLEKTSASGSRGARTRETAPKATADAPRLMPPAGSGAPSGSAKADGVQTLQRMVGNQEVMRMLDVQRAAGDLREPSDEVIRAAAVEGVRTPSTPLPYLDRILASFGRHSIGDVQAHVGPAATRASRAMNAQAYATGNHVVFGARPDLRTAAHEVAHVVQQRAGVHLSGGIGRLGDPYERNADAVGDAVVAGRSAERLLEGFATPANSATAVPGGDFEGLATPSQSQHFYLPSGASPLPPSQTTPSTTIQMVKIGDKRLPPSGNQAKTLWEVIKNKMIIDGLSPHGAKTMFMEFINKDDEFSTGDELITKFIGGARDWAKPLSLPRPQWPRTFKSMANPGEDIRHIVRNATLKNAIVGEWEFQKKKKNGEVQALSAMREIADAMEIQENYTNSYSYMRAIYNKAYLNPANLFTGPGAINRVIGLTADSISAEGFGLLEDNIIATPDKISAIFNGVREKIDRVAADQKNNPGSMMFRDIFLSGLKEFHDGLRKYLSSLEDYLSNSTTTYSAIGEELLDIGANFGFDLPDSPNPHNVAVLVEVENELASYEYGHPARLADTLSRFIHLDSILIPVLSTRSKKIRKIKFVRNRKRGRWGKKRRLN